MDEYGNDVYFKMGCWVAEKFKLHKISSYNKIKKRQVNSGQVWFCNLGYNVGDEKNKSRPVLIVSNNKINRTGKVVVICITDAKGKLNKNYLPAQDSWYLLYSATSNDTKKIKPNRVIPAKNKAYEFLDKDSIVQCEEIRAVSKARLDLEKGAIGELDQEDIKFIKEKFQRAFNF